MYFSHGTAPILPVWLCVLHKILDWRYLPKQLAIMVAESGDLTSTWLPLDDHLAITHWPLGDHSMTICWLLATTRRSLDDHLEITRQSSTRVQSYVLLSDTATGDRRPATTRRPHGDHWRLHDNQMVIRWWPDRWRPLFYPTDRQFIADPWSCRSIQIRPTRLGALRKIG